MSATTLTTPVRMTRAHARPSIGRLTAVELRKMVDTRAGFWLQVATALLTAGLVIARAVVGDAAEHTFTAVLNAGIFPAAVLLPVVGILLVTSEWSQRTGMITFGLVPVRSRVLGAKLLASLALSVMTLAMVVGVVAAAVVAGSPPSAWTDALPVIGQSAIYLTGGMLTGVAFGMVVLASAPAIVALFALPIAWTAIASLSVFADVAPWLDTRLSLGPLTEHVVSATQWGQAGTSLAVWMLLPLLIGTWRITRREIAA